MWSSRDVKNNKGSSLCLGEHKWKIRTRSHSNTVTTGGRTKDSLFLLQGLWLVKIFRGSDFKVDLEGRVK